MFGWVLPSHNVSSVDAYGELVLKLLDQGVEVAAIHQRLEEQGFSGSYSSVYRYVRRERPNQADVTVRVECRPGEEAQVDFGYAGYMHDPETEQPCKSWAFVKLQTLDADNKAKEVCCFPMKWWRIVPGLFSLVWYNFIGRYDVRDRELSGIRYKQTKLPKRV
jgi:hypothetical protein